MRGWRTYHIVWIDDDGNELTVAVFQGGWYQLLAYLHTALHPDEGPFLDWTSHRIRVR